MKMEVKQSLMVLGRSAQLSQIQDLTLLFFLIFVCPCDAASRKIAYQGQLKAGGVSVTGPKSVIFKVYDAATSGNLLWQSAASNVNVSTGLFRTSFEPIFISTMDWENKSPYLEISVGGTTLSPREELTAAPYAINTWLHMGKRYTTASSVPTDPILGDLWMDTTINVLQVYTGAAGWAAISPGLPGVSVAPGNPNSEASPNPSIWINDTGGGDLLRLQKAGSDQLVVSNTGALSTSLPAITMSKPLVVEGSINATTLSGDGSGLTNLSASNLVLGMVPDARLSSNVALLSGLQIFTGSKTFTSDLQVGGSIISALGFITLGNLGAAPLASRGRIYFDSAGSGALRISLDGSGYVPIATGTTGGYISSILANSSQFSGDGAGIALTLLSSSVTLQGNAINVANGLVKMDGSGSIVSVASVTASGLFGIGAAIANLDANNITLGTLADARLPGAIGAKTFTGTLTFNNISGTVLGAAGTTQGINIATHVWVSAGNVGIGLTNPMAPLQVFASGASPNSFQFIVSTGTTPGQELIVVRADGNMGIGTSNPGARLEVAGGILATNLSIPSDRRIKEKIVRLEGVLKKLDKVHGITFHWKGSENNAREGRQIGLIAQEVENEFPELVSRWSDKGYLAIDYGKLTAVLLEALKELRAELQTQIERQSSQIEDLKALVCTSHPEHDVCRREFE